MKPRSQRLNADELERFLSACTPAARSICIATRQAVLETFPDAVETSEGKELGYGFDRGYRGLVFAITSKKHGVNLGVSGGATLDDPAHLMRGTGKTHRHVEIVDAAVLSDLALKDLLARAVVRKRNVF